MKRKMIFSEHAMKYDSKETYYILQKGHKKDTKQNKIAQWRLIDYYERLLIARFTR